MDDVIRLGEVPRDQWYVTIYRWNNERPAFRPKVLTMSTVDKEELIGRLLVAAEMSGATLDSGTDATDDYAWFEAVLDGPTKIKYRMEVLRVKDFYFRF
jgi:hypothetical protein